MPEELESPNKIFRGVIDRVMHEKDDSHNDISQIKQEPEFQKTLMSLNARKNLLIKATAKQYGITPDQFKLEDEIGSFYLDNSSRQAQQNLTEKTNFYQVKKLIALESNEPPEPTPRVVAISDYFILNHKSNFVILWDVLMGVLCVYTAFFYAYASLFDLYDMRAPDRWTAEIV